MENKKENKGERKSDIIKGIVLRRIIATIILFSTLTASYGDLSDWIADQIRSGVESMISPITNYNSNYMGSFGSFIWESVVSAKCESDLEDKAKEFENFEIDRSYLYGVPGKYPLRDSYWQNCYEITPLLYDRANSYFHTKSRLRFNDVGGSKIDKYAESYIDSISALNTVEKLETCLTKQALDSLAVFDKCVKDSLLCDVKRNRNIAIFLNNHTEAIRIYNNSLEAPKLRANPKHLLYWSVKADSHRSLLSKKEYLINPRSLSFVQNGDSVAIVEGKNVIATIVGDNMIVCDINIMNLLGRPNTTYIYRNNTWTTDRCGRVINTTQSRSRELTKKEKKALKTTVKIKTFKQLYGNNKAKQQAFYNSLDYGAPEVLLNIYYYEKTKENKKSIKELTRNFDSGLNDKDVKSVEYCNTGYIPKTIDFNINNLKVENPSVEYISQTPTNQTSKTYSLSLNNVQISSDVKTNFFKSSGNNQSDVSIARVSENLTNNSVIESDNSLTNSSTGNLDQNTSSWSGKYRIYSDGYRFGPPPISVQLTLTSNGGSSYKGSWIMRIADDDVDCGKLCGDVTGVVSNGVLTLTMTSNEALPGSDDNFFADYSDSYPRIPNGSVIAKITKTGSTFKIQPVGKMAKYLTDLNMLEITKIK